MPHLLRILKKAYDPRSLSGISRRLLLYAIGGFLASIVVLLVPDTALYAQSPDGQERFITAQREALSKGDLSPEMLEKLRAAQEKPQTQEQASSEAPRSNPQAVQQLNVNRAAAEKGNKQLEEKTSAGQLGRYGFDLFAPSRKRILMLEEAISKGEIPPALQKDALAGFVGPLDMISASVNASIPPQYVLNPGDQVTVYYWGDLIELISLKLKIDENGEVAIPQAGKMVVRGMSLAQFQKAVQDQLQRVFGKHITLIATLDRLRSMQIFITGGAFRPGSYAVSSVTSLFNALYACGGTDENGSLRDIRLVRDNKTIPVDFYDFLMQGDSRSDYPLQPGDTIFIGRKGKLASIAGEVGRPALYELKGEEGLRDLVRMANGIKPSGLTNKVLIQSIIPHKERIVIDVDLSRNIPETDQALFDRDAVMVEAVVPEIKNMVTLAGDVKVPGTYELKKNMRVADLFNEVNELRGDAYLDRADVIRLDKDRKTTTIIPINLGKALIKDPEHNIELASLDKIVVYSKWDVKFYPEMKVTIRGAVQKPGDYVRSEGMRLKDLLIKSGGLLPDTFMERADIIRYNFEKGTYHLAPVQLSALSSGDSAENILLADNDILRIYSLKEASYIPSHEVEIVGNVQRPATYTRSEGMRLKDLLRAAGGALPGSSDEIVISKARYYDEAKLIRVKLDLLEKGDESQNVLMDDQDIVMVRSDSDFFMKPQWILISGEVKYPGSYPMMSKNYRLSELIRQAGGLTKAANPKGAVFLRKGEFLPSTEQKADVLLANDIANLLNRIDFQRQSARNMLLLKSELGKTGAADLLNVGAGGISVTTTDASAKESVALAMTPTIAQAAGQATGSIVGAMTPGGGVASEARKLSDQQLAQSTRVIINLEKAMGGGSDNADNIVLMNGDTITIPLRQETVSIVGAVMNHITTRLGDRRKVSEFVSLAGGYAKDADQEGVLIVRVNGTMMPAGEVSSVEEGDIIYVPTRVLTTEILTLGDKIISAVKYTLATVASVVVFLALIH